jgi:hypothetical protein
MTIDTTTSFTGLDIDLLRQQKLEILTIPSSAVTTEQFSALAGIINLLDTIQDQIVANGTATEEEVFGPKDENGVTELEQYAHG